MLAFSKGHTWVGVSLLSVEDGNRPNLPNAVFHNYLELGMMNKAHKRSDYEKSNVCN
jgi:hypothetical protein